MEFHLSLLIIIGTTFFVIVLAFLHHILSGNKAERGNLKPPQAKGAWPIIGHLHLLGGSQLPHKVLGDMAEKYGPIFTIKLGVHQTLVVSNPEIAKECFTTNDKVFATRPTSEVVKILTYNYAVFAFGPYGHYWREIRKITVLELLSQRRVQMLGCIRVSELRESIKEIYDAWLKKKKIDNLNIVKVDMKEMFGNLVLKTMVRIITGKRFSLNGEEGVRFHEVIRKYFELLGAFVVSDYIPYLKCLDVGGYLKVMKKTAKELDDIFEGWLKEHKSERGSTYQHEGSQAFINVLINTLQANSEKEFGFDRDTIIKATCQLILTAGLDTTSATLTWALSLLLNNPKKLEIAQKEIDEHVGRERLVEESDLKNLVYLEAIIKETLRLYPVAPILVPHESLEDCILAGYKIPKGTHLIVNVSKIQHDPNIWSDPYSFQPERFLTSQKGIDMKGKHFELLPFGSGRRMCPGDFFSLQAIRLTLASVIQQFDLKNPSNELIDMKESAGLTISKEMPLEVLVSPRLSVNVVPDMAGGNFPVIY